MPSAVQQPAADALVTKTTATQTSSTTTQPAGNPMLNPAFVSEVGGLILMFGAILTLINRHFDSKAKTREEKHQVEHERLNDRLSDHKHDIAEVKQKVVALEHFRSEDVARIVKVETELKAINESQARIEHQLDTMRQESKDGRAELVSAIRRLQDASLKPRGDA